MGTISFNKRQIQSALLITLGIAAFNLQVLFLYSKLIQKVAKILPCLGFYWLSGHWFAMDFWEMNRLKLEETLQN